MTKKTMTLEDISQAYKAQAEKVKQRVILCAGTGCVANGSLAVREEMAKQLKSLGMDVELELKLEDKIDHRNSLLLSKSGCQGFCQQGPLMHIEPAHILYVKVRPDDVREIIERTLVKGEVIERLLYRDRQGNLCKGNHEIPFYNRQHRVVLANCMIEPASVAEYIFKGGYFGARKAVMEGNPHAVIEGMMIAARGIGADEGYVYVRAEYPLAVERMRSAVRDAEELGLLGDNLFGSKFSFRVNVMEGAGAFVCGEETALIASVEGKRGMPRPKPPFPAQSGLWGKPTVINNVETLASLPVIFREGAEKYRSIGTEKSPGTKTFALTGHVANTGLIEVPFGATLREIVYNIGGGVTDNSGNITEDDFKAVQIGGPSGGCLTKEMLDLPMDFDSLKTVGAMVGSGGLVVMNKQTCIVKIARFFMQFTQNESCGKCVPCREGTKQMLALLDDIIAGRADAKTLELLEETAKAVQLGSLCGLGKTAPNPVLSTLRHFRQEYEEHVFNKSCPTGECRALAKPEIDPEKCKGCTACARKCPVGAITGAVKQVHHIDQSKCIKCGACKSACKFDAVRGL